jgi:hypothetical protein
VFRDLRSEWEASLGRGSATAGRVRAEAQMARMPWFAQNLNTGDDDYQRTRAVTVDETMPSALVLPVELRRRG